jgi:hypothetical protein
MTNLAFMHLETASEEEPTFPIEVYFSTDDGGSMGWLVNPSSVDRWKDWPKPFLHQHFGSQITHYLETYGTPPERVCRELAARAGTAAVHSITFERDQKLLDEFYRTALHVESPIVVQDAVAAFIAILSGNDARTQDEAQKLLQEAFEEARTSRPPVRGGAFEIPFLNAVENSCRKKAGT